MSNVRVNWVLPTKRTDGRALPVSDIAATIIALSADGGAHFADIARIDAPATTFLQTELESGTYIFRLTVVDEQNPAQHSSSVDASVTVAAAAPGPVTDVTVTIE